MTWALGILVVVTWLARRSTGYPGLVRLRSLLPAWRFFDRVAPVPSLWIRWAAPGGGFGPWSVSDDGPRGVLSWAFAPEANLVLAYHVAVEQLVAEIAELELAAPAGPGEIETDPAIVGRASYEVVSRIARRYAPAAVRARPGARLQWKLVVPGRDEPPETLVSLELAA